MNDTDLLGRPLTDDERAVVEVYERLKALVARDGLPPCVQSNARFALAAAWQMVNDLGLVFEQLDEWRV